MVMTRRLMIRLTVITGRFGLSATVALDPRAGSRPWASWYARKPSAAMNSAAETANTASGVGLRLLAGRAGSVILAPVALSGLVAVVRAMVISMR